jgi:hypothetical protein
MLNTLIVLTPKQAPPFATQAKMHVYLPCEAEVMIATCLDYIDAAHCLTVPMFDCAHVALAIGSLVPPDGFNKRTSENTGCKPLNRESIPSLHTEEVESSVTF